MTQLPTFQAKSGDFSYTIVLELRKYIVRFVWNIRSEFWHFTITDEEGGTINGVKLVTQWPLLTAHRAQIVMDGNIIAVPGVENPSPLDYDNLDTEWRIVHMSQDELDAWRSTNGF